MQPLHHHQVTSRPIEPVNQAKSTRKGRRIPREYTRQLARRDTTGGTSHCDICKLSFSATYTRPVYLNLKDGTINACLDCIRDFDLRVSR